MIFVAAVKVKFQLKLAAQIATDIAIGTYGKIYAQIDPNQLGAIERAINIANDYGKRLKSDNVKQDALDRLVSGYSSHSFVIDIKEAKELFSNVREPTEQEQELGECISLVTRDEIGKNIIVKLNELENLHEHTDNIESLEQGEGGSRKGSNKDN